MKEHYLRLKGRLSLLLAPLSSPSKKWTVGRATAEGMDGEPRLVNLRRWGRSTSTSSTLVLQNPTCLLKTPRHLSTLVFPPATAFRHWQRLAELTLAMPMQTLVLNGMYFLQLCGGQQRRAAVATRTHLAL